METDRSTSRSSDSGTGASSGWDILALQGLEPGVVRADIETALASGELGPMSLEWFSQPNRVDACGLAWSRERQPATHSQPTAI